MAFLHVNHRIMPCQGILFDKDGTLLDFMAMWGSWAELVLDGIQRALILAGARLSYDPARLLGTVHDAVGRVTGYDPAGPLSMATMEETQGVLTWHLYNAGIPWNEALTSVENISREAMAEVRRRQTAVPLPGLLVFLQQCVHASLKLGVVTSDGAVTTAEHLEWLGISNYFGTVVTRDRVKNGKPAPEMAVTACLELGLAPEETIIIGDSNADMQMGRGAGLCLSIGLAAKDGSSGHLHDADTVIVDFTDLVITT